MVGVVFLLFQTVQFAYRIGSFYFPSENTAFYGICLTSNDAALLAGYTEGTDKLAYIALTRGGLTVARGYAGNPSVSSGLTWYRARQVFDGILLVGKAPESSASGDDIVVAKRRPDGGLAWSPRIWVGDSSDIGYDAVSLGFNYLIIGTTWRSFGADGYRGILLLIDTSGFTLGTDTAGGSWVILRGACPSGDGGVVVAGYYWNWGTSTYDALLAKLDASLTPQWAYVYPVSNTHEGLLSVVSLPGGGFAACGVSWDASDADWIVLKVASDGSLQWFRRLGGSSWDDGARDLLALPSGNLIVVGPVSSWGAGAWDAAIAKFSSSGTLLKFSTLGSSANDGAEAVCLSSEAGFVYVAGWTDGFGASARNGLWAEFDTTNLENCTSQPQTATAEAVATSAQSVSLLVGPVSMSSPTSLGEGAYEYSVYEVCSSVGVREGAGANVPILWNGRQVVCGTEGLLRVFTADGRLVLERQVKAGERVRLDLPSGVYLLRLKGHAAKLVLRR